MEPRSDPGGARSDPGGPKTAPRAAQEAEKRLKKGLLLRSGSSGGSGGRFWSLWGSIWDPQGVDFRAYGGRFSQFLKRPKIKISG